MNLERRIMDLPGANGRHDAIGGAIEVSRADVLTLVREVAAAVKALELDCHDFYSESSGHESECAAINRDDVLALLADGE